jgi:RNA polymerase sigma-70 factor (ECF subfamily)
MVAALAHVLPLTRVVDDDEVLVGRVLRGDALALRDLYGRHSRYLAGVVYRLMGDDAELEDIVQDTFVRAAERLPTLREPAQLRAWLVTIAVRLTQSRLTRRRRRSWIRQQLGRAAPKASDPKDRAPADELYSALDQVPDRLRLPWILHRVEGFRLEDVAASCGVSLATIKRRIADAQTRLDRRLGGATP